MKGLKYWIFIIMSAQLIELLVFAGIAFIIITKLISVLGTTSDDEYNKKSFFGEKSLKDVTNNSSLDNVIEVDFLNSVKSKPSVDDFSELVVKENRENIIKGLIDIQKRIPSFELGKFLRAAKVAFQMIIDSAIKDSEDLTHLVDKRYLEIIQSTISNYGKILKISNLEAKVSEIYMFGNNAFVKILFTGKDITDKVQNLNEEWVFSKSLINPGVDWYLSNIDRHE